jgi:hypothetical protein
MMIQTIFRILCQIWLCLTNQMKSYSSLGWMTIIRHGAIGLAKICYLLLLTSFTITFRYIFEPLKVLLRRNLNVPGKIAFKWFLKKLGQMFKGQYNYCAINRVQLIWVERRQLVDNIFPGTHWFSKAILCRQQWHSLNQPLMLIKALTRFINNMFNKVCTISIFAFRLL